MHYLVGNWAIRSNIVQRRIQLEFRNFNFRMWSIIFFGSDNFSIVSLEELLKERNKNVVKHLEVVTTNMLNPVYKFSVFNKIKVHLWPAKLDKSHDLGVVVSFGKLIPEDVISLFPYGIINVHASLLPKWRGGMPIVHAIKNGDTTTGITIQIIKPCSFDTGDVIMKRSCSIGENELMPSLFRRLSKCGSECLAKVLQGMPGSLANGVPQTNEKASYAKKLNKEVAIVKWNDLSALEVYNLYRALFGLYELKTTWQGIPIKLLCLTLRDFNDNGMESIKLKSLPPGSVRYSGEHQVLLVTCRDKPIGVCTLAVKGKLYCAKNFYRGFITQSRTAATKFGD